MRSETNIAGTWKQDQEWLNDHYLDKPKATKPAANADSTINMRYRKPTQAKPPKVNPVKRVRGSYTHEDAKLLDANQKDLASRNVDK